MLNLQELLFLSGIQEIEDEGTFICVCKNPDFNPLMPLSIEWGTQFCDFGPGGMFEPSDMLCNLAQGGYIEYGNYLELYGEGCEVSFWQNHETMIQKRVASGAIEWVMELDWPTGYNSNHLYNDLFQTNLALVSGPTNASSTVIGRHDVATEDDGTRTTTDRYNQGGIILGPTLEDALNARGGGINLFARESVAALLNAAQNEVNYLYSVPEVMQITQQAIVDEDYIDAIIKLKTSNTVVKSAFCSE